MIQYVFTAFECLINNKLFIYIFNERSIIAGRTSEARSFVNLGELRLTPSRRNNGINCSLVKDQILTKMMESQ